MFLHKGHFCPVASPKSTDAGPCELVMHQVVSRLRLQEVPAGIPNLACQLMVSLRPEVPCSLPEEELGTPDLLGSEHYELCTFSNLDEFFQQIYRCAPCLCHCIVHCFFHITLCLEVCYPVCVDLVRPQEVDFWARSLATHPLSLVWHDMPYASFSRTAYRYCRQAAIYTCSFLRVAAHKGIVFCDVHCTVNCHMARLLG